MSRPVAHLLGALAALVVVIAVSALWVLNLRLGPPLEGWTAGATVIFVPMVVLILSIFAILARDLVGARRGWLAVLVGGLLLGLVVTVVQCGGIGCFAPGMNRLSGWFTVIGPGLAVLAYHLVLARYSGERSHAVRT